VAGNQKGVSPSKLVKNSLEEIEIEIKIKIKINRK